MIQTAIYMSPTSTDPKAITPVKDTGGSSKSDAQVLLQWSIQSPLIVTRPTRPLFLAPSALRSLLSFLRPPSNSEHPSAW